MRWIVWLLVALIITSVHGADSTPSVSGSRNAIAHGDADGSAPGWNISTTSPVGWTTDCCQYAKAIGVNLVLYKGDWTGDPDRVMVLNVWPSRLPTLAAELKTDQDHYLKRDPLAKVSPFALNHPSMPCHGVLYQGTDHIDDIVVFCDPGEKSGVRLSWSMTVNADDKQREHVTSLFRDVVQTSVYAKAPPTSRPMSNARPH